ncbi:MAG: hypothetical protein Q7S67_04665 [Telluria sp.]|nr:hypothetical protein [Telluria sp.]
MRLGVSPHGLALCTARRNALEVVAEHSFGPGAPGFEGIAAGVRELLAGAGCAGWPATIVLADELARLWQVVPPPGSARLGDLEAAAALRFQTLYGEPAAAWKLAAGWDAGKPFLAAAMPRQLLALLEQGAREQRVDLVEIVPQFVAGWNRWCGAVKPGAWYGQVQGRVLTLGAVENNVVIAVRAAAMPDTADAQWLDEHIAREALRLNLPVPERIAVSGQAPHAWSGSCILLAPAHGEKWSPAVQLAATGGPA